MADNATNGVETRPNEVLATQDGVDTTINHVALLPKAILFFLTSHVTASIRS